ncbi:hypothetical protein [Pedobacter nototheniae]|uniref:hypothetical protein n=1 Tax=Pedobacter nototheniae TaxID=2488994 RepID=UPI00292F2813|nr:hypothetical protein [Pedobacter nototheniae]
MKTYALYAALVLSGLTANHTFASVKDVKPFIAIDSTQEAGYKVINQSAGIETIKIRKIKKGGNILYITLGNKKQDVLNNHVASNGISGKSLSEQERDRVGPLLDKIDILNGGYDDIKIDKLNADQNVYTIKNINFPLRLSMKSGKELIEFEIKEPGRWDVNINYKNN